MMLVLLLLYNYYYYNDHRPSFMRTLQYNIIIYYITIILCIPPQAQSRRYDYYSWRERVLSRKARDIGLPAKCTVTVVKHALNTSELGIR